MDGQVGLERISGWIGKARLNDHLHIPKSERKSSNIEKKDGSQIPRRKKTRSENQGVTGTDEQSSNLKELSILLP